MSHRRLALLGAILFLATFARYGVGFDPNDFVHRDPESQRLAYFLFEHGTFANPFVPLDTGPSAHLSPVFPAYLCLFMKLFGTGSEGMLAVKTSAVFALSLEVALFPVFSEILGIGLSTGIIAAFLWLIAAPRLVYGFENRYAAAFVAALCCSYYLYSKDRHMPWLLGAVTGFVIFSRSPCCYSVWRGSSGSYGIAVTGDNCCLC